MEQEFVKIAKNASAEGVKFLKAHNYVIDKHYEFNLFALAYALQFFHAKNLSSKLPHLKIDFMELRNQYINEIQSELNSIEIDAHKLDKLTEFVDQSRYPSVGTFFYESQLELFLNHKGILIGSFTDLCSELEKEFKEVITAFKDFSQQKGKLKLPYKAYISFFKYPIVFLNADYESIHNICKDYEDEIYDFLVPYCKLTTHLQNYIMDENIRYLKKI